MNGTNDKASTPDPMTPTAAPDEASFDALVNEMVGEQAPGLFAVVQEEDDRSGARVAAWGMAFEDGAEVVTAEGGSWMKLRSAESACRMFGFRQAASTRLVWIAPARDKELSV